MSFIALLSITGIAFFIGRTVKTILHATPWLSVPTLLDVKEDVLARCGVKGIIISDDSLVAFGDRAINDQLQSKFDQLEKRFDVVVFPEDGTAERYRQLQEIFCGYAMVSAEHFKGERHGYIEAAKMMSLHPDQIVVIGHSLDSMVGGSCAEMKTIRTCHTLPSDWVPLFSRARKKMEDWLF